MPIGEFVIRIAAAVQISSTMPLDFSVSKNPLNVFERDNVMAKFMDLLFLLIIKLC